MSFIRDDCAAEYLESLKTAREEKGEVLVVCVCACACECVRAFGGGCTWETGACLGGGHVLGSVCLGGGGGCACGCGCVLVHVGACVCVHCMYVNVHMWCVCMRVSVHVC